MRGFCRVRIHAHLAFSAARFDVENGGWRRRSNPARTGSGAIYCAFYRQAGASGMRDKSRRYRIAMNLAATGLS